MSTNPESDRSITKDNLKDLEFSAPTYTPEEANRMKKEDKATIKVTAFCGRKLANIKEGRGACANQYRDDDDPLGCAHCFHFRNFKDENQGDPNE